MSFNKSINIANHAGFHNASNEVLSYIGDAIIAANNEWIDEKSYIKSDFYTLEDAINGFVLIALSELKEKGLVATVDPTTLMVRPTCKSQEPNGRLPNWAYGMYMRSVIPNEPK